MIGYEFLQSKVPLRMPPLDRPARVTSVTRIERAETQLSIPKHAAPKDGASILDHALFALKHEPMQMALLHEAMKLVSIEAIGVALIGQPTSANLRRAAFIWEKSNNKEIPLTGTTTGGNYVDMFDKDDYYTGEVWEKSTRLRVNFNGIGPYSYCPVVQRDPALEKEGSDTLAALRVWATSPRNQEVLERVMNWAYLSETRDSYAIEKEVPSPTKEKAFLSAMEHLSERRPLTIDYLVGLQNTVITEPYAAEAGIRSSQNWLQRGGHGSLSVRYVPPPPDALGDLMDGFLKMANSRSTVPPLIKASLVSFGFVFLHPFIDGNGRLSRLLAHHSLNYSESLPDVGGSPAILPLSVAMKRSERIYLETLESFSKPARALWDVKFIDDGHFVFDFASSPMVYASWSGDRAARFITDCAKAALNESLMDETAYIEAYDLVFDELDRKLDLPNKTINLLIQWTYQNGGRMPEPRKNEDLMRMVKPAGFQLVETVIQQHFGPLLEKAANKHLTV